MRIFGKDSHRQIVLHYKKVEMVFTRTNRTRNTIDMDADDLKLLEQEVRPTIYTGKFSASVGSGCQRWGSTGDPDCLPNHRHFTVWCVCCDVIKHTAERLT